jgi:hypothetical protein
MVIEMKTEAKKLAVRHWKQVMVEMHMESSRKAKNMERGQLIAEMKRGPKNRCCGQVMVEKRQAK